MGLGISLDEQDLDERLSRQAWRRLASLDDEIDSGMEADPDTEAIPAFYRPYRPPKEPKPEIPEHLAIAHRKAQKARAIINRQRRKDPSIRGEYSFGTLIIYFSRNPQTEPGNILQIIKEDHGRGLEEAEPGIEIVNGVMRIMAKRTNTRISTYIVQKYHL